MDQTITTPTAGWMSYDEFAEQFYETPLAWTNPDPIDIPENELPY